MYRMMSKRSRPTPLRCVTLICAAAVFMLAPISQSQAFELFGITFFGEKKEEPAVEVPDPLPYEATLELTGGDKQLKSALESASELISRQNQPPSGEAGLIARGVSDLERLVGRLYIDGRFGGTVDIEIGGTPLQEALQSGDITDRRPAPVTIKIAAGPRFKFGRLAIKTENTRQPLPADLTDPAAFGLLSGDDAGSGKVFEAETEIVAAFQAQGYPHARVARREIVADHNTRNLDVTLIVTPGGLATFGPLAVEGVERTDPAFVAEYAFIPMGARYDPRELRKAEKRLNDLGIFSSVRLVPAEELDANGSLPITIIVTERKRNVIGAGANYSSTEGFGVEGYWRRRNLFGRGELLSLEGSVGRIGNRPVDELDYSARVAFEKPGAFGPLTRFTTSLGARQETPDAYRSKNITADAFVSRDFSDQLTGRVGGEVYYADEEDVFGSANYFLVGLPADLRFDNRDDRLNPTKGINATLFAEPAYDIRGSRAMGFLQGEVSTYAALDDARRFVLAGKLGTGSILGPSLENIPASRRYYLGGGGTIRGYAYKNVGPRLNNEVTGGRSFFLASGEVRMRVTESIGVVGFVDAGNAFAARYPDFSQALKVGVGAGLRYFTPVGPLRVDVAVPLDPDTDDPDFAVYVGLSQAF